MFWQSLPPYAASPFLALIMLTSCEFREPDAEDASAIFGCYTALDAPAFALTRAGMKVEGAEAAVPFRYEFRKVGYVLSIGLDAKEARGHLTFAAGDNHHYRVMRPQTDPSILVYFGEKGSLREYKRDRPSACAA